MNGLKPLQERHQLMNQEEYQVKYNYLKFLSPVEAAAAENERQDLMDAIGDRIEWGFNGTKADVSDLSKGCQLCGEGQWSCLFINNLCNGKCFYCPTQQSDVARPTTNTLAFDEPETYVEYIRKFGFKGVSISGGEPLISFDKSQAFVKAVKDAFGDGVYVWLYTNGILLTPEKVEALKQAGLDEMRFDIGATEYQTDQIKLAVGHIPVITVEIPAVPQEEDLLKQKIRELKDLGVNHLNLHQMRLTPHNFNQLIEFDYTFLHGEKVTVLESELTALRLIQFNLDEGIGLPVNYCSFVYKNRFQQAANRKKHAPMVVNPWENMTENGYIRRLFVKLDPQQEELLKGFSFYFEQQLAFYDDVRHELSFHHYILDEVEETGIPVQLEYQVSKIFPQPTGLNPYKTVVLDDSKEVVVERRPACLPIKLDPVKTAFLKAVFDHDILYQEADDEAIQQIMGFEFISEGLGKYY